MRFTLALLFLILYQIEIGQADVFDITKYGAQPNGDITQAVMSAWKDACASPNPSSVVIPKSTYVMKDVDLVGPCKAPINVQVQGIVKAPSDPGQMTKDKEWISFQHISGFRLDGGGTLDGMGSQAWTQNDCTHTEMCNKLPNTLNFNDVSNAIIDGITSKDSKLFHVNVIGCKNITFHKVTISAPGTSPNTDGIHVGRSSGINITDCTIGTGDDCVSIGDGTEQMYVTGTSCGPGHGISVGSLGRYPNEAPVNGVYVRHCTISNTLFGARVKAWPNGLPGSATDIHYEDIIVENVGTPVLLDEEYCPQNHCSLENPSKVKITNTSFKNIRGTSSTELAVKIACSKLYPCEGIEVADINLTYQGGAATSTCSNSKPTFSGTMNPPACATA